MSIISATSICNEALVFLGEKPLLVFPEATENSDRCAVFYERAKESELIKHPWNAATFTEALTRDAVKAFEDYLYSYSLPPKLLVALDLYPTKQRWKRRGPKLATDSDTAELRYIKNINEGEFTSLFASVVSARMAFLLAQVLTERVEKAQMAMAWYEEVLSDAKRVDSHETSIDHMDDLDSVHTRWRSHYNRPDKIYVL